MRCSKCGYVGFAHLESCLGCGALLNLPATGGTPIYLGQSALDISPTPELKIPLVYGEAPEEPEEEPPSAEEVIPEEAEPEPEKVEEAEAGEPLKEVEEEPPSLEVEAPSEEREPEAEAPVEAPPSDEGREPGAEAPVEALPQEKKEEQEAVPEEEEDLEALWAQPVEDEEEGKEAAAEAAPEGEEPAEPRGEEPAEPEGKEPAGPEAEEPAGEAGSSAPPEVETKEEPREERVAPSEEELAPGEEEAVPGAGDLLWERGEHAPEEPAEPGGEEVSSLPGRPVGLARRALAGAIDFAFLLLITLLFAAGTFIILRVDPLSPGQNLRAIVVLSSLNLGFLFVLSLLYNLYFLGAGGQTIGAMVFGFEVVRGDGAPLGYRRALLRYLGFLLSCLPLFLGLLLALADKRGRALHDRLSGSIPIMAH